MKKRHFKTLIFKGARTKLLGHYAMPLKMNESEYDWAGGDIPRLMTMKTTINKLEKAYPALNFKEVRLIIVEVIPMELKTNKT